ncbi:MAG: glycosyl transferase family 2, partial [Kiloniellaceae bacterium]|nr:glycosyl transferase family 2 [Kiloniellaceae bacterium]
MDAPQRARADAMGYRLVEIELTKSLAPIELTPGEDGIGLIARWHDRLIGFEMIAMPLGSVLSTERLNALADERLAARILAAKVEDELLERRPPAGSPLPSLSIAICTKDRAPRLSRLLSSLDRIRERSAFNSIEIIVVDNAS